PIIVIVRPEVFDGHVLALDIASFAEPFSECCDKICAPFGRTTEEKPDHWHRRLLRVRRERARHRCAAEKRDELAPFHCPTRPVPPTRDGTPGRGGLVHPPPGRNEMIAITPPIISVAEKQATPFPRQDLLTARNRF